MLTYTEIIDTDTNFGDNLMLAICEASNIILHDLAIDCEYSRSYLESNGLDCCLDRSCSAGNEIWLGVYTNAELKLISFFHELGHCLDTTQRATLMANEIAAWHIGLTVAHSLGVIFSDDATAWAMHQVLTYKDYK